MAVELKPMKKKVDYRSAAINLSKSIVSFSAAFASSEPVTAAKGTTAGFNSLIDAAEAAYRGSPSQIEYTAWDIARSSFVSALAIFISRIEFVSPPPPAALQDFVAGCLEEYEEAAQSSKNDFSVDVLLFPLLLPAFRQASSRIPREIMPFTPRPTIGEMRKIFEKSLFEGIEATKNSKPEVFARLNASLTDEYAKSQDKRAAHLAHEQFLVSSFAARPIFGQESTGITVSDLYIRQRCIWYTVKAIGKGEKNTNYQKDENIRTFLPRDKIKYVNPMHIGLMHETLMRWVEQKVPTDGIRVVAGGPGSGKSTFARSFAVEIIDSGLYDVLFIPLQELEPTGSFETRLENLFRIRTELGFERVPCPLTWMGKSSGGMPPSKPLLLICDGLDEIAPPDTAEASNVTTDFIQSLNTWMANRNSGGCFAKAVVLGRDIAAKEAFGKLSIDDHALLIVGGLKPINKNQDYLKNEKDGLVHDPDNLAPEDQRIAYWQKWAEKFGLDASAVPMGLTPEASEETSLQELTAEPLLLYLLLWTDYLGTRWREAADNRNVVYEAIFHQIFVRDWGGGTASSGRAPNRMVGGHVGTKGLSEDEFFLLQEALGLAAWPTGARTVTKASFDRVLKLHLPEDIYEDLLLSSNVSFKSVALQSYTRNADSEDVGYEFVHKSIGEYLVGRGLVRVIFDSLGELERRVTDDRCKRASLQIAKLAHSGILTKEIDRFLRDQIRLHFSDVDVGREIIQLRYAPVLNWALRNMFPVHQIDFHGRELSTQFLDNAERRSMDVFWTFGQHLLGICYSLNDFQTDEDSSWDYGPLKPNWPSSSSASSLIMRMYDRVHSSDTSRICTFNRIDFTNQLLTDMSLGTVLYQTQDKVTSPANWIGFSASGSLFEKSAFFSTYLSGSDLSYTKFIDCAFSSAKIQYCNLGKSVFMSCDMSEVDFTDSIINQSEFHSCSFEAAIFHKNDGEHSTFIDCAFGAHRFHDETAFFRNLHTVISNVAFSNSVFRNVQFGKSHFDHVQLQASGLTKCDFSNAVMSSCGFDDSTFEAVTFSEEQVAADEVLGARREELLISDR